MTKKGGNKAITYNKEHYTLMANDVVRGKQDMTLQEARILRLLITQVVKEDNDLKTYTANIQELAKFLNISDNNLYRDIGQICYNLAQRVVKIGTGNAKQPWKVFAWLSSAEYNGAGTITLRLSDQIKPFVLELNDYFTQYKLSNILEMKSFYAIRLYELIKTDEFKGQSELEYSIEFLRQFFDCEKKYTRINDFKRKVIDVAIREINEKSDIQIDDVEFQGKGRKYDRVVFKMKFGHYFGYRRTKGNIKTPHKV